MVLNSPLQENAWLFPETAPHLSEIRRQNLRVQLVYEYEKHKVQGNRNNLFLSGTSRESGSDVSFSEPRTSVEPSFGDAAFSATKDECSSIPSRRTMSLASLARWPRSSLADTVVCMPDNPFADAAPSGDTPSSATQQDPMQDIVKYSHVVTAEHEPKVTRVSGITGTWPERAEIVDPSRGFPGPAIPRGTFSQAKSFFLKSSASGGDLQGIISRRTRSQDNPIMVKDKVSIDYLNVDVPRTRNDPSSR
ncbi:uncharacterized protein EDB91DRAFT_1241375 [Suillus paluster]|uniref:uncharacterized protein n=1 Tax=Suillus paluster TaxID=48578 RepID=UPI001B872D15|nr:uncharacterized protein EDB91DRAFT_1241375 [Suillus paluster]KAG1756288.1 hypothetical protein EDB91DRAFT_1241375 [Suillus paluster]